MERLRFDSLWLSERISGEAPDPLIRLGPLPTRIASRRGGVGGALVRHQSALKVALATAFLGAAAGCSLLALVNGPVGPATYSPQLTRLRPLLDADSTLVLAPAHLLADEHGRDFLVWELRGGWVCVGATRPPASAPPPPGVSQVITLTPSAHAPFSKLRLARWAGPYILWRRHPAARGHGSCPLISVGRRADPAGGGSASR